MSETPINQDLRNLLFFAPSHRFMYPTIPVAVVDAIICISYKIVFSLRYSFNRIVFAYLNSSLLWDTVRLCHVAEVNGSEVLSSEFSRLWQRWRTIHPNVFPLLDGHTLPCSYRWPVTEYSPVAPLRSRHLQVWLMKASPCDSPPSARFRWLVIDAHADLEVMTWGWKSFRSVTQWSPAAKAHPLCPEAFELD